MDSIPIILMTVAATSDSFIVGFNYGVKGVWINRASNLFIALLCFAGTFFAMLSGRAMASALSPQLVGALGGGVLVGLGLYMIISFLWKQFCSVNSTCSDPHVVDKDRSNVIELRESVGIGFFLSLNNMGLGVGVGLAGLPIAPTSLICAAASFVLVGAGSWLGARLGGRRLSRWLEALSALLVLLLGVLELLG